MGALFDVPDDGTEPLLDPPASDDVPLPSDGNDDGKFGSRISTYIDDDGSTVGNVWYALRSLSAIDTGADGMAVAICGGECASLRRRRRTSKKASNNNISKQQPPTEAPMMIHRLESSALGSPPMLFDTSALVVDIDESANGDDDDGDDATDVVVALSDPINAELEPSSGSVVVVSLGATVVGNPTMVVIVVAVVA